jgi:hypothetical protein
VTVLLPDPVTALENRAEGEDEKTQAGITVREAERHA